MNGASGTTVAGRYQLLKQAGQGGMGDVYLARDLTLRRQVAVKTISEALKDNPEVRQRIDRECELHARLPSHSGIIALYDKIEEHGNIYLILEYFEGETLSTLLKRLKAEGRELPLAAAIDIICQVLDALRHIHAHDILHRDIKPANIMVAPGQNGGFVAKLMDFGIAAQETPDENALQLTSLAAQAPGTPAYMAPERIDPAQYGQPRPATDLYAVGIIFYEMLSGSPPFQGTLTEIFVSHLSREADPKKLPARIPEAVRQVVFKSLRKNAAERYQQADSMKADLRAASASRSPAEAPAAAAARSVPANEERTLLASDTRSNEMSAAVQAAISQAQAKDRRKNIITILCVALAFALIAGGLAFWLLRSGHKDAAPAAQKPAAQDTAQKNQAKAASSVEQKIPATPRPEPAASSQAAAPPSINSGSEQQESGMSATEILRANRAKLREQAPPEEPAQAEPPQQSQQARQKPRKRQDKAPPARNRGSNAWDIHREAPTRIE